MSSIIKNKNKFFRAKYKNVKFIENWIKINTKNRTISDYKSMSKNELIDATNVSKPTKKNKKIYF